MTTTTEDKAKLLAHHMSESRRLLLELGMEQGNAFDDIGIPPAGGAGMASAADSAEVRQAINSLKAQKVEANAIQWAVGLIDYAGERMGMVLGG